MALGVSAIDVQLHSAAGDGAQSTMSAGLAAKRRESPATLTQFLRVAKHTGPAHNVCTMPATDIVHIGRRPERRGRPVSTRLTLDDLARLKSKTKNKWHREYAALERVIESLRKHPAIENGEARLNTSFQCYELRFEHDGETTGWLDYRGHDVRAFVDTCLSVKKKSPSET